MGWKIDEARDLPLSLSFTSRTAAERLRSAGLPSMGGSKVFEAAVRMGVELTRKWEGHPGRRTSYPKNRNKLTQAAGRGPLWSPSIVPPAAALMGRYGFSDNWDAPQHRSPGKQSTIVATARLIDAMGDFDDVEVEPGDPIRVNDREGNPIAVRENSVFDCYRLNASAINEFSAAVRWSHPELGEIVAGDPLALDQFDGGLARFSYHRVFCIDGPLSLHGRWYGHTVQCLPRGMRPGLMINDRPTTEVDFARLHIGLAYRAVGAILTSDPYDIAGHPTDIVKRAVNVALNARTRSDAQWVVAAKMADPDGRRRRFIMLAPPEQKVDASIELDADVTRYRARAGQLLSEIEGRHHRIADLFYRDTGMKLMAIDAFMMEAIMIGLMTKNIPFGAVHDSVIVPVENKADLIEEMAHAAYRSHKGDTINIPASYRRTSYTWDRGRAALPVRGGSRPALSASPAVAPRPGGSAGYVVLDVRQPDLFAPAPRVSVEAFERIGDGHVDPAVLAVLSEPGLGIRKEDIAARIGVSRSHLANVRSGRFNLSPIHLPKLKRFISENARTIGPY